MIAFLIRRLLQSVLVMFAVGLLAFMMFRYLGDPINNMLGEEATREQREELRERLRKAGTDEALAILTGKSSTHAA